MRREIAPARDGAGRSRVWPSLGYRFCFFFVGTASSAARRMSEGNVAVICPVVPERIPTTMTA
jgi:hypothetical protein